MQPDTDTDIGLTLVIDAETLVLAALLTPESLARRVAACDGAVERQRLGRADVADIVAGALHAGRWSTPAERAHMASLVLWLAMRDPVVADAARRGGIDLAWHAMRPAADGEPWQLAMYATDRDQGAEAPVSDRETHETAARPAKLMAAERLH